MKTLLSIAILTIGLSAFAAETNTVTVKIDLSDLQTEQLKFLKRYYGATNSTKDFATNVVLSVTWTPTAELILSQRRERVTSAMATITDDQIKAVEDALGLPPLVSPTSTP